MSEPGTLNSKTLRMLELYSCAGGAGMGYHHAGFEVVGVDIEPQPRYPFEFHQADALEYVAEHGHEFDAIHASPPCQDFSRLATVTGGNGTGWLLGKTLDALRAQDRPWVVENVPGAPLDGITLCGTMFGLKVKRHRLFESSISLPQLECGDHSGEMYSPAGHGDPNWRRRDLNPHLKGVGYTQRCRDAMGIQWMNRDQLAQAIPPAYTEWIGRQMVSLLRG